MNAHRTDGAPHRPPIVRPVHGVLFDMDGTLLDSRVTVPGAYVAAVRELGGIECTPDDVVALYSAGPTKAILATLLGRPTDDSDVACYVRHLTAGLAHLAPYPGIRAMLDALREAGLPLGVFTGAGHGAATLLLRHAGIADAFAALVGGDEIARVKPAPDGILLACERLGLAPAAVAYVGDAPNDMRCARAAGSLAVGARWGHQFDATVEADVVVAQPSDVVTTVSGPGPAAQA